MTLELKFDPESTHKIFFKKSKGHGSRPQTIIYKNTTVRFFKNIKKNI